MTDARDMDRDVAQGFASLKARAAEMEPSPTAPGAARSSAGDLAPAVNAWREPAIVVVEVLAAQATNWTITQEHKMMLVDALADCAEELWPGGLENINQWGPWAKLGLAAASIGVANFDWQAWQFKPLKRRKSEMPDSPPSPEKRQPGSSPKRRSPPKRTPSTPKKRAKKDTANAAD